MNVAVRLGRSAAALLLPVVLIAGCGDKSASTATDGGSPSTSVSTEPTHDTSPSKSPSGSPSETTEPPHAGAPRCSVVWRAGHRLDRRYTGCNTSVAFVERGGYSCSSGQRMVTYDSRFWSVLGGTIKQTSRTLVKDRRYLHDLHSCRA